MPLGGRRSHGSYISSQAVYGVANTPPFHEHSQIDPSTGYSQSKLAGELIVRTLQEGSTDWMILRLSRLYGFAANIRWQELPHMFARIAVDGGVLDVYRSSEQLVDLLHIKDAVLMIVSAAQSRSENWNDVYNVGGGVAVSVLELAELCRKLVAEHSTMLPSINLENDRVNHLSFGLVIDKATERFGWRPEVSLYQGIAELMNNAAGTSFSPGESSKAFIDTF